VAPQVGSIGKQAIDHAVSSSNSYSLFLLLLQHSLVLAQDLQSLHSILSSLFFLSFWPLARTLV
jgi:hypothetical protein